MSDTKKSNEMPATQGMLYEVRDELKSEIASLKLEVSSVRNDMSSMESRLGSKIDNLASEIKDQNAKFHRMLTLYEEIENRNKYALDGYTSLNDRLEKLENPN